MKILFKNKWLLNNLDIKNNIINSIVNDNINLVNLPVLLNTNNINFIEYIINNCNIPTIILNFLQLSLYFGKYYFLEKTYIMNIIKYI